MTAQRRGRNGYGGRRKQKQPLPQQCSSDEESTDAGSVTRCVCGESHNLGLMVQCDQCEVWQHCDCVGLEEQDIPEQYYCEECKPENHSVVKMTHGRMRRSYSAVGRPSTVVPVEKKAPKKRMTFNSREASMSLEDVLAARNALEFACPPLNESAPSSPVNSETADVKPENPEVDQKKSPAAQESDDMDVDIKDQGMETAESEADVTRPAKPKRTSSGRKEGDGVQNGRVVKSEKRRGGARRMNSTGSRRNQPARPRSRTSTPQPAENGTPVADASTTIFEKLSPAARESSPPAKIRYPSARMSISEMNRRAKQILEYISSIQVDMATKDAAITVDTCALVTTLASASKPKPAAITIPEKTDDDGSPSSSLSSASTIPLDEAPPNDEEKSVAEEAIEKMKKSATEQSSMEIMDVLTRELIRFQRRFGAMHDSGRHGRGRHRDINDDTGSEGEGRVTRSREASTGSTGIVPERRAAHA